MGAGSVHFERGKRAMANSQMLDALAAFEAAHRAEPDNAEFQSFYGLLHALERGRTREGLDMARAAAERAPDLASVHLNLARVLTKCEDKAGAVAAVRKGLEHHPRDPGLLAECKLLGVRRPPTFKNLPRGHWLNKYVGKLTWWWATR